MQRKFRLTRSNDYRRVRRQGKSYAHPLVVLVTLPNEQPVVRVGLAASHSLGHAVDRNRAKRRLRAVMQEEVPGMKPGWDVVLLARKPLLEADFRQLCGVVHHLLARAGLLEIPVNDRTRLSE